MAERQEEQVPREGAEFIDELFQELALDGGNRDENEAGAVAQAATPGAPGNAFYFSSGFSSHCVSYRSVRIALLGDFHPLLAYNKYIDSELHPPGDTFYDIEAKYYHCEGIDGIPYTLAHDSFEGADWVVLRTLSSDFLRMSPRQVLQLAPELAGDPRKSEREMQEIRIDYLKALLIKYVAAATYIYHFCNMRLGRITPVAVVLPSLGDVVKFNSYSRRTADMDLDAHNKELISSFYQTLGLFQTMWKARSKITLIHEKQVLATCGCGEVFAKNDRWSQFHTDCLFPSTKGMGKLLRGVCVRMANSPRVLENPALFNDIDMVQGLIDTQEKRIRKEIIDYGTRIPRCFPRHTGWGMDVFTTFIMGGCVRCFDPLLKEIKTAEGRKTVDSAVNKIVSSGFWLNESELRV